MSYCHRERINSCFIPWTDIIPVPKGICCYGLCRVGSLILRSEEELRQTILQEGKSAMNWDRMEGHWKQQRGKAVHHWGKVMSDELAAIAGKYEELVGRLQERYGIAREEAQNRVAALEGIVEALKKSNARLVEFRRSLPRKEMPARKRTRAREASSRKPRAKARK